jgi:hypothetical protein
MRRLKLPVLIVALLGLVVAVTPPGLCPCWLLVEVERVHVHPAGDGAERHSHDYLFELFNSHAPAYPPYVISAAALIALLLASALYYRPPRWGMFSRHGWRGDPDVPPPRVAA